MIKALFLLWTFILQGFVPSSMWPESLVGPMPSCTDPQMQGALMMCGADPAYYAFLEQLRTNADGITTMASPIQPVSPARISNGF